jgi:hypothetical protein
MVQKSSESDVNYLEQVDGYSETFSDFYFDFCEALYVYENFVDDLDDWNLDSDIDNDFSANNC